MAFTVVGRILAILSAVIGVLQLVVAIAIANGYLPARILQYLMSDSTQQAMYTGAYMLVGAIALGIVCEMSESLHRLVTLIQMRR